MNQDADIDRAVKVPLVTDMVNLLGLKPSKRYSAKTRLKKTGEKMMNEIGKARPKMTTAKDVMSMNGDNFKNTLKAEDYLILLEAEEEFIRKGNFRRVFPTVEAVASFSHLFDVERPNNLLLWKYLELKKKGTDILNLIFN